MKQILLIAFGLGLAGSAFAQAPPPAAPDPLAANLQQDWMAFNVAYKHLDDSLAAYVAAATAEKFRAANAKSRAPKTEGAPKSPPAAKSPGKP